MGYRMRKCKICGEKFKPTTSRNIICSKASCKLAHKRINREKNKKIKEKLIAAEGKTKKKKVDTLAEADAKAREEGLSYGQRELRIWMEQHRMERRKSYGN